MEKYGIEKEVVKESNDTNIKVASVEPCEHPASERLVEEEAQFCKKCGKYIN